MLVLGLSVLQPELGTIFWTTIIFLFVLFVLRKVAFKPIVNGLKIREYNIQSALDAAEEAKKEMDKLKESNAQMLQEAREEKMRIINESKEIGQKLVKEAEAEAKVKATRIIESAQKEIETSKRNALEEVKNQAGLLAVEISEKLTRSQLDNKDKQESLVKQLLKDSSVN